MPESFGARLRQCREQQNIALSAIAERTKIQVSLLEGLERGDVSRWPSGIFRRAYIRAYAQAVGLPPGSTVREFLEAYPDPDETAGTAAAMLGAAVTADAGAPPSRLRNMVDSAILSLARFRIGSRPEGAVTGEACAAHAERQETQPGQAEASASGPFDHVTASPTATTGQSNEALATLVPKQLDDTPVVEPGVHEWALPPPELEDDDRATHATSAVEPAPADPQFDLAAFGRLCTELGRVDRVDAMKPLLSEAAGLLGARGLIVWLWDAASAELRPALAEGYSDRVLAQLPGVSRGAANATAAAFRSERVCTIEGDDRAAGALVVPLLTPGGCSGVLALELADGRERDTSVRALASILGALMAQLVGATSCGEDFEEELLIAPVTRETRPRRVNVRPEGSVRLSRPPDGGRARLIAGTR